MLFHRFLWIFILFYWFSIDFHAFSSIFSGFSCFLLIFFGFSHFFIDFLGILMFCYRFSLDFHAFSVISSGFSCFLIVFLWGSCKCQQVCCRLEMNLGMNILLILTDLWILSSQRKGLMKEFIPSCTHILQGPFIFSCKFVVSSLW